MAKNKEQKHVDDFYVLLLRSLWTQAEQAFTKFNENCKYRTGVSCNHEEFHVDFALANICLLKDCPRIQEEED